MKEKLKWIPNMLCIVRIVLVFVFIYLSLQDNDSTLYWALFIFLLAGATDVLDGFLARKNGWITELGKILDPFADKLMQCTVVFILSMKAILPNWFALVFFFKEIVTLVMGLIVIKRRNVVVVSKWYGKAAACLFYLTVALSIIFKNYLAGNAFAYAALCIPAAVFALGAFAAYVKHYYSSLKRPKKKVNETEKVNESL
ncbi:MAG: CDP-alcohol phosphatidyltransferase family protein [Clostridia bacterium]|nr:CDP-alcohol phosphatidyltransferase family protein [Clostridia bacterium]MBR2389096.1 CDP-alcohol phosphatidyltransferase family protein [Clostridia bacterium]